LVKQIAGFVLLNSNPDNIRFTKSSSSMMNNQLNIMLGTRDIAQRFCSAPH
jgi:hypothetical protein